MNFHFSEFDISGDTALPPILYSRGCLQKIFRRILPDSVFAAKLQSYAVGKRYDKCRD